MAADNNSTKSALYPSFPKNLTSVTWEHAVNSKKQLEGALKSNVHMLEADVSVSVNNTPIMAHPPSNTSDLSLDDFLRDVLASNTNNAIKKGIKLDFKSDKAFNLSIPVLQNLTANLSEIPVFLNADILKGAGGGEPGFANPKVFLDQAKNLSSNWTLSVGWTTNWTGVENYTLDHVKEMNKTLIDSGINQRVTFAVRASLAAKSNDSMKKLVETNRDLYTLTVWSPADDSKIGKIEYANLRKTILNISKEHVFVDMPPDQLKELKIENASGPRVALSSACIILALGAFFSRF